MVGAPLGLRISHQRMPETSPLGPFPAETDLIGDQRFVITKITVGQPEQWPLPVTEMVDLDGRVPVVEYRHGPHERRVPGWS